MVQKDVASERQKAFLKEYAIIALVVILFFATWLRAQAVSQRTTETFDEKVYLHLAGQLMHDPTAYSMVHVYHRLKAEGKPAPEYLKAPLFKHPPLFPYIVSLAFRIFGNDRKTGIYTSLVFGVLTIIALYYIAVFAFDERRAILAALFLAVEPVHVLCSKRVWLETSYVFFIYAGILFLILGLQKNGRWLIASGVAFGLSLLTKEFAVLSCAGVALFVIFIIEEIRSKRYFGLFILLSFLVVLPWLIWLYRVYGQEGTFLTTYVKSLVADSNINDAGLQKHIRYILLGGGSLLITSLLLIVRIFCDRILSGAKHCISLCVNHKSIKITVFFISTAVCVYGLAHFFDIRRFFYRHSFNLSQDMYAFNDEPLTFYIDRLTTLFPVYYFVFISLLFAPQWNKYNILFFFVALPPLLFFSFFREYECRYILASLPALILLASDALIRIYDICKNCRNPLLRFVRFGIPLLVIYLVTKAAYFDFGQIVKDIVIWQL
ncbi:MAG: glycosyltransferase family 39 protein [Candidatus Omnitrophica bacterium]|nr:glycosyltransferase family 39 protein [Candidatus Omnitrophota bacterium]